MFSSLNEHDKSQQCASYVFFTYPFWSTRDEVLFYYYVKKEKEKVKMTCAVVPKGIQATVDSDCAMEQVGHMIMDQGDKNYR
jgi:hypothetical protein